MYVLFTCFVVVHFLMFSLFMNVSKPRPNDHPLLVLFIIGGITCSEVHQIREAFAAYHPNTQVSSEGNPDA